MAGSVQSRSSTLAALPLPCLLLRPQNMHAPTKTERGNERRTERERERERERGELRTVPEMRWPHRPYSATVNRPSSNKLSRPISAKLSAVKPNLPNPAATGSRAQTWGSSGSNVQSKASKSRVLSVGSHPSEPQAGGAERHEAPDEDEDELGDLQVGDRCVCECV
jgi:hypothetical protein